MDKKAQGLPMDVIIIAILVMLVLVIVGVIVMIRMGFFSAQVSDCEKQQPAGSHICTTDSSCGTTSEGEALDGFVKDTTGLSCKKLEDQPRYCCFRLGAGQ